MSRDPRQLSEYHLYIDLIGEEGIFKPLYDYLDELDAKKLADYPIWFFRGKADARRLYGNRIGEILSAIPVKNEGEGFVEIRWSVLLMSPKGHSGFSRGLTPSQYEHLINNEWSADL